MDRKRSKGSIDELAIIKAAAWAWYQRGSGFEGRSVSEYDAARSSRVPKPSRYKQEAMRRAQEEKKEEEIWLSSSFKSMVSPSHTDNSLLDRYEIERISKELDYYIKFSNTEHNGGSVNENHGGRKSFSLSEIETSRIKGTKKKKKGFWLLGNRMVCRSKDDVVENIGFLRRRPE